MKKKQVQKNIPQGIIHINASFNNTLVTITDMQGNVISAMSSGQAGFKGSRKATPFAASQAAKVALDKAKGMGLTSAHVKICGVGPTRESALRALQGSGIVIKTLKDTTPIPHGGVRAKKPRRV